MRRYYVRLQGGRIEQVENRNDAYDALNLGMATDWWIEPAADYDPADDFARTSSARCGDCGTRLRPRSLESLPPHGCVEKQRANRAASQAEED